MKKLFAMTMFMVLGGASYVQANNLEGLWLTQNERSVIELKQCDDKLCGYIYWITDGGMQYDTKNPDEAKRNDPMCGLKVLWGMKLDGDNRAKNGKIYKADDGDIYDAKLEIEPEGTLKVRGFMGLSFLGKTQYWTPVKATDYPVCKMP